MNILKIALPLPLRQLFDYLPPAEVALSVGMRVRVPFGRQKTYVGMVLALSETSRVPADKLKAALTLLDTTPILSTELLQLLRWSSDYYHHPIGEVIAAALPALLRQGQPAQFTPLTQWRLTKQGAQVVLPSNAHRQRAILSLLQQHPEGLTQSELKTHIASISKAHLNTLVDKGWLQVESRRPQLSVPQPPASTTLILNPQQQQAVEQIQNHRQQFYPCLLAGVTGSGKTEVYLHSIQMVLAHNQQALVLVPEINLTPQMIQRFQQRLPAPLVVIHSRLTDKERLQAWLYAQSGEAAIIIGTRSAVWTPWVRPGIIIVDEEHDPSYKQQEHYRYSARDVAVRRAQQLQIPIILGSATPSLESFYNAQHGRYHYLSLPERAGNAVHPQIHVVDMRTQKPQTRLSTQLIAAIKHNLAQHQQTLLFINRRGYAPVLMCYQCGWIAQCHQCDARLTYHEARNELHCHHCGLKRRLESCCPQCQQPQLNFLGQGTQRIEATLKQTFATARIARIDRDSTQGDVHTWLTHMHQGEIDILVGTQMLAKGHHFPQVTLVGIINMDSSLYSIDFRASERMAQLFVQVAGRAGRAETPGQVIIQTHHPDHPLLTCLTQQDYHAFVEAALQERQQAQLPPYSRLALLRAEAKQAAHASQFLLMAKSQMQQLSVADIQLLGPVSAPMEKRAGWYRSQLLMQAHQRTTLHAFLQQCLPLLSELNQANQVRWSLDVDPQDLF